MSRFIQKRIKTAVNYEQTAPFVESFPEIDGYCLGSWAVRKAIKVNQSDRTISPIRGWEVTHIPTCRRASSGFRSRKSAELFVIKLHGAGLGNVRKFNPRTKYGQNMKRKFRSIFRKHMRGGQ